MEQNLAKYKGSVVVLEWNNPECPFVKKHYSGNMQRQQKDATGKDVVWLSINSSAPGKQIVQELLNTVAFFCSALALAAFAFGAATWGIGGRMMHSSHGAAMGKMTMLAAVGGAILLGAGPAIIAWAMDLGNKA